MLKCANRDPIDTLRIFKNHNLSPSFLVPTQTGLEKSIMDATYSIRQFLSDSKIHNYENQKQGIKHILHLILKHANTMILIKHYYLI